jgi:hypothetical protein
MTNPKYKNIERFFNVVDRSLFTINTNLSYERTLEAIERLCQEIIKADTSDDESVWWIGEFKNCSLDNLIVGAYWYCADYNDEDHPLECRVYDILGDIYYPNMSHGPEDCELDAYNALGIKNGSLKEVEVILCFEDKTWEIRYFHIPTEAFEFGSDKQIIEYLNSKSVIPDNCVFASVYELRDEVHGH